MSIHQPDTYKGATLFALTHKLTSDYSGQLLLDCECWTGGGLYVRTKKKKIKLGKSTESKKVKSLKVFVVDSKSFREARD